FNDDIFLNAPVKEEDFFVNGLPCDSAVLDIVIPLGENDVFYHTLLNDVDVINKHYNKKRVVGANKGAWYSIKYGKELMRNICLSPWRHFGGFKDYHLVNSFLKSSFANMYEKESNAFERTYQNHFRSWDDITQHLIRDYQLCEGKFYPRKKKGRFFEIGKHTENIVKAISEGRYAFICLNDDSEAIDFKENKRIIIEAFEKKYPQKSSFEI
ncbi:MAG: hypothetical protein J5626_02355, partial [Lachnospiraceae bacterium]|nr:hypothetical protein [Lachnospiraceae bacterium]